MHGRTFFGCIMYILYNMIKIYDSDVQLLYTVQILCCFPIYDVIISCVPSRLLCGRSCSGGGGHLVFIQAVAVKGRFWGLKVTLSPIIMEWSSWDLWLSSPKIIVSSILGFSHNHGSGNLPQNERKLLLEGPIFPLNHDSGVESYSD